MCCFGNINMEQFNKEIDNRKRKNKKQQCIWQCEIILTKTKCYLYLQRKFYFQALFALNKFLKADCLL